MNAGLAELAARDAGDYVRIAARLAADLGALARLRSSLRPQTAASPLYDRRRFAADFAHLIRRAADRRDQTFA